MPRWRCCYGVFDFSSGFLNPDGIYVSFLGGLFLYGPTPVRVLLPCSVTMKLKDTGWR